MAAVFQYMYTWAVYSRCTPFLEREIVRLTLFNNFIIHNYMYITLSYIYDLSLLIFERRKTGVPGKKHPTQLT